MPKIFLTNLGKYNEGELIGMWVKLPFTDEEIETCLEKIGIDGQYEEYFITDYEDCFYKVGQYESIYALNEFIQEALLVGNNDLINAVFAYECIDNADDALKILENIEGNYTLHTDIQSEEDYGHYYVETYHSEISNNNFVSMYLDYETIGSCEAINNNATFTKYGLLEKSG